MANRLDYRMSVAAIEGGTYDIDYSAGHSSSDASSVGADFINPEIGKTLGGGKSDTTWNGDAPSMWAAGACTHVSSASGTTGALSAVDGLWIKHTGFDFADGTTVNTAKLIVKTGSTEICRLSPGGCLFLEDPADATFNFDDDGVPCQVEYAILT